eukprot:scaffold133194_cov18-Tisochrysis_lutea.AAC.1
MACCWAWQPSSTAPTQSSNPCVYATLNGCHTQQSTSSRQEPQQTLTTIRQRPPVVQHRGNRWWLRVEGENTVVVAMSWNWQSGLGPRSHGTGHLIAKADAAITDTAMEGAVTDAAITDTAITETAMGGAATAGSGSTQPWQ